MTYLTDGLAQKLVDLLGISVTRYSDMQIFAVLTAVLFIISLITFLTFVFKLIVYISKT